MPQQIFIVHGGETFKTYGEYLEFLNNYEVDIEKVKHGGWKDYLQDELGDDYEVIFPHMENYHNAKYAEWKVFFSKFYPYLKDGIILIGSSLGGTFLAKYLSENDFPFKIKAVFLIAAPYDEKDRNIDYDLGDFILPESLERFSRQAPKIFLYYSKDDPIVPFSDLEKYANSLPNAEKIAFEDRGHFKLKKFPEFIKILKNIE